MDYSKKNIVVVGLGYVGLPLAVNFANTFDVIGYDISDARINSLKNFKVVVILMGIDSFFPSTS